MKNSAYIGAGSNIADRYQYLCQAVQLLDEHDKMKVVTTSSIYETDPVGYTEQDLFLNMVIKVETVLNPYELLETLQEVEQRLGRKREIRWGPRTIDLDILLYNQENIKSDKLIVPHPRMHERAFVLVPLFEIDKDRKPTWGNHIPEEEGVRIWKRKNGEDVFALFEN